MVLGGSEYTAVVSRPAAGVWNAVTYAEALIVGTTQAIDLQGYAIADLDSDGANDLVVGATAYGLDGVERPLAFQLYGPFAGTVDLESASRWGGPQGYDVALVAVGDVDGTPGVEVLVGINDLGLLYVAEPL